MLFANTAREHRCLRYSSLYTFQIPAEQTVVKCECYCPDVYLSVLVMNYSENSCVYFVLFCILLYIVLLSYRLGYGCGLSTTTKDTFDFN